MIFVADTENTTSNKGNPFDLTNNHVLLAYKIDDTLCSAATPQHTKNYSFTTYFKQYKPLLVFFNAKYDLHWFRRQGFLIGECNVWCCQLAEFILEGQTKPYPSLNDTAKKYGLGEKIDVIKNEYWDKGIDTDEIPTDILTEYAKQDVNLTHAIYKEQVNQFNLQPQLFKLFKLLCADLLVLEEMEWNGIKFDYELCENKSEEVQEQLGKIVDQLSSVYPDIPINFNSGDQLSAFLYGGTITETKKVQDGFYKTGQKAGQPKFKNVEVVHTLPRLVEPLEKSELKKEGVWATDENTLKKLKGPAAEKYVGPLLEFAKLEKLDSTYYSGLLKINEQMNWPTSMIHGQFNQCVAATGRLSSSKPNLQNFAGDCLDIFVSRYD